MRPRSCAPACLLLTLAACSGGGDLTTQTIVRGAVVDAETQAPLEGVRITTMPPSEVAFTDAEGQYSLQAQLGVRYQVRAELDGYAVGSQAFTPQVSVDAPLDFALELLRVCNPGERRCVRGDAQAGVETCAERGNLWDRADCADGQACDPADTTCRPLATLTVTLEAGGGVIRTEPLEGQPDAIVNCGTDCEARFFRGTEVTLVATPLSRSAFTGWTGACADRGTEPTCVVVLDGDVQVGGGFETTAFGLTLRRVGQGNGRVRSMPEGIDCGGGCSAAFDRGSMVTLTAAPGPDSILARWERDCSSAGSSLTCTLTMDENKDVRARFEPMGVPVEVQRAGSGAGTVTSRPAGIDCGADCLANFEDGADVTLTASAAAGSTFVGWSGDCAGTELECVVTADAPRNVTATFDGIARALTVERGGDGRVVSAPAGIDCGATCAASFGLGTQVDLTATPDPDAIFAGWGLDCAGAGTDPVCTLTLDADRRARADFVPFYLAPLPEDAACVFAMHLDTSAPNEVVCGAGPSTATIAGTYAEVAARTPALGQARAAGGADEQGYVDVGRRLPPPPRATVELTVRRDGPAFEGRGRAALVSDLDLSDPATRGLRLSVLDDGMLVVSTRDGAGGTTTASSAVATLGSGTWYHVAATVDLTNGMALFVDGVEVARTPGPVAWTASSSTAWVGAEREGPAGDSTHRFDGALDEVRVSDVVRY